MSFISSYKYLEKLCGEVFNDERRISAYIDEMQSTPNGAFYVHSWDEDLKTLKHYRWVRNQIAHEPDCDEQNICDPSDALWLDDFYSRIMNQTDPLALYRKATTPHTAPTNAHKQNHPSSPDVQKSTTGRYVLVLVALLIVLFIAVFFFYLR